MPRHPPCALHSLSHKHNTTTTTTKTRTNTPQTQGASVQDARVHYADLKQQTHQEPRHAKPARRRPRRPEDSAPPCGGCLILQDPTVCQPHPTRPQPPGSTPHNHQGCRVVLRRSRPTRGSFIDDSTSEHHQCHPLVRRVCGVCAP